MDRTPSQRGQSMRPATRAPLVSRSFSGGLAAPAGSAHRRRHTQVPGEQQQSPGCRGSAEAGLDGEALPDHRLHGRPDSHRRPPPSSHRPGSPSRSTTTRRQASGRRPSMPPATSRPCSPARIYVEDSIAPQTTITGGPSGPTTDSTPTFTFISNEAQSTFRCRFDSRPLRAVLRARGRATPPPPRWPRPTHLLCAGHRPGAERGSDGRPAQFHGHPLSGTPQGSRQTDALRGRVFA